MRLDWSREEEFTGLISSPQGRSTMSKRGGPDYTVTAREYINYNSGAEGMRPAYAIENQHVSFQTTRSPLRQGA